MHTDLARAFRDGALFWDPDREKTLRVTVVEVGEISFPTGAVVAADPGFLDGDVEPLSRRVPVGRWLGEVTVATEEDHDGAYGTVAAMRARFRSGPPTRWVPAFVSEDGQVLGVGVDGDRIAVFDRRVLDKATPDMVSTACFEGGSRAAIVEFAGTSEMFVSDAGKGDGCYPVWWGTTEMARWRSSSSSSTSSFGRRRVNSKFPQASYGNPGR